MDSYKGPAVEDYYSEGESRPWTGKRFTTHHAEGELGESQQTETKTRGSAVSQPTSPTKPSMADQLTDRDSTIQGLGLRIKQLQSTLATSQGATANATTTLGDSQQAVAELKARIKELQDEMREKVSEYTQIMNRLSNRCTELDTALRSSILHVADMTRNNEVLKEDKDKLLLELAISRLPVKPGKSPSFSERLLGLSSGSK